MKRKIFKFDRYIGIFSIKNLSISSGIIIIVEPKIIIRIDINQSYSVWGALELDDTRENIRAIIYIPKMIEAIYEIKFPVYDITKAKR